MRSGGRPNCVASAPLPDRGSKGARFKAWLHVKPCCMEQTCRRNYPSPARGSGNADGDRASEFQHAIERMDGDVHLGRPTPIRVRA